MRHPCRGMTSRTTPVGVLVLALAGIFGVGCSAQTSAVFEALLDSAGASASASAADTSGDAAQGGTSETWWPHQDGYDMDLPSGWFGVGVDRTQATRLIDAVGTSSPGLASRMTAVLGATTSRVSGIAGDPSVASTGPVLVVLAQPRDGRRKHEVKLDVKRQIGELPGLAATPFVKDAGLPTAPPGWRFDYSITDEDLGPLRVRSYLFVYGNEAFLLNFVAPESIADDADSLFDAIAESIGFGV